MTYLVLARKYRPQTFDEVYAQDHIVTILKNSIDRDRIAHAYLFTGPRGVGKTSLARIFSKSLNCLENGPSHTPCNQCRNCIEITQGTSADVIEIDGASNTGVDDIRDLQRELMYSATNSRYKIYIIDEVHMLSKNAFNALLKTLEEPPENVIFIFATTEPHKVLPTIISRCQRHDFKRITIPAIIDRLEYICKQENIEIEEEALHVIAKKADGSMRDAQSLMDQIIAVGKEPIKTEDVLDLFGIVHTDRFACILTAVKEKNPASIVELLQDVFDKGNDIQEFLNGLMDYIRNLFLLKIGVKVSGIPKSELRDMEAMKDLFDENTLLYITSLLLKTKTDIKTSNNPMLVAEMSFIKLAKLEEMHSLPDLISMIQSGKMVAEQPPKKPAPATKVTKPVQKERIEPEESTPKIDSLTPEIFEDHYQDIMQTLEKEEPVLASCLSGAKVSKVEPHKLTFSTNNRTNFKLLEQRKSLLQKVFQNYFGIKLICELELNEEKNNTISKPDIEDIKKNAPDLADFIDITDSVLT